MLRKCSLCVVFLMIGTIVSAQGPAGKTEPVQFLMDVLGDRGQSGSQLGQEGGLFKWDRHHDDDAHSTKPAGIVIYSTNTTGCEGEDPFCTEIDEPYLFDEDLDFWVLAAVPQMVEFKPSSKRSNYLEIIWNGSLNISSGTPGDIDQQVYLRCTVMQKGNSIPCSNTCWVPSIAQDVTGGGLTNWVTYHGYAKFNPKHDVTVEIRLFASQSTRARVCEDTLILKY